MFNRFLNVFFLLLLAFAGGAMAHKHCPYVQQAVGTQAPCCVSSGCCPCPCGCAETGVCDCKTRCHKR